MASKIQSRAKGISSKADNDDILEKSTDTKLNVPHQELYRLYLSKTGRS